MTNQEIYDRVKKHLLTQMKQSYHDGMCFYRSPEGLQCAIGCLIPDDKYDPDLEGTIVGVERLMAAAGLVAENTALAASLQSAHDDFDPCRWEEQLRIIAEKHGLVP